MTVTTQDFIKLFRSGTTAEINDAIAQLTKERGEREAECIYAHALKIYDRETEQEDGPVHDFFSFSYSSYQVVPRVLAQSMPHGWQARFVALMEEMQQAFEYLGDVDYDVRPAQDVYASELTEKQRALTGVTRGWDAYQDREIYWDREGNEIPGYAHVMVPVSDPLPPYNRGRTRMPRANQLGKPVGGWILWDSEGRWMHTTTWSAEANRQGDGWRAVSINEAEAREFQSKGCQLDQLDAAGWRAYNALRGSLDVTPGSRDRWLAKKAGA